MRVADYIISRLVDAGLRHVFLVPGGAAMHLNDSLLNFPQLEYIQTHHEHAAAVAAESYSKLAGLGCAMVTAGPGTTNCMTGLASAWVNSSPVVFLSGQVRKEHLGTKFHSVRQRGLQEVATMKLVRPLTKYAKEVLDPEKIGKYLDRAIFEATTGRRGPVWLSVPLDVQSAEIDEVFLERREETKFIGSTEEIAAGVKGTIGQLRTAKRPLVLFGSGIRNRDMVADVVKTLGIPFQLTWAAADFMPDNHTLFAGRPGLFGSRAANFALANCDFLLCVGARLDLGTTAFDQKRFLGYKEPWTQHKYPHAIVVDADYRELRKVNCPIAMEIHADGVRFLSALMKAVDAEPTFLPFPSAWTTRIHYWEQKYPVPAIAPVEGKLSSYTFVNVLSDCLQEGDIIVSGSAGNYSEILMQAIKVKKGQRILADWNLGAMGYGIPAAIGAAKASGKRVVLVDGDGSLMPNLQELETIGRLRLPICIFVLNNGGYASIRQSQQNWFGRRMPDMLPPVLSEVANSLDIFYEDKCASESPIEFVQRCLTYSTAVVCEIFVDHDEPRSPRVASSRDADGNMVTDPIEDMTPKLSREELAENMK